MKNVVGLISLEDLGWVAGVLDMQGAIVRKHSKVRVNGPQFTLYVESRRLEVVRRLTLLTGTAAEARFEHPIKDWMRKACTEHCPEPHVHPFSEFPKKGNEVARWTVSGGSAGVVLHNVMPYMQTDRGFTEFFETIKSITPLGGQGTSAVIKSLRRLLSLGWEFPDEYNSLKQRIEEDP